MKTIITKKHEYLSGWTMYDMTWKMDYSRIPNKTIQSAVVVSKDPFSNKVFKEWAAGKGCDIEALFTKTENVEMDCKEMNKLVVAFNKEYGNNLNLLNSDNKCHVSYSAAINPNYRPLVMAFDTIQAYDVKVRIEYKSGVLEMVFLSQGRKKNDYCPMIMLNGKYMGESLYEEKEAIFKVESRIERLVEDCDTDEKFVELSKKLSKIQASMKNFR